MSKNSKLSGLIVSTMFGKFRFWQDTQLKELMATTELCLAPDHLLPSIRFLLTKVCAKLFGPPSNPPSRNPLFTLHIVKYKASILLT